MYEGLLFPEGYKATLTPKETQTAVEFTRDAFQKNIRHALNLRRVTCPLFVTAASGINDDLNGVERKVEFDMLNVDGTAQVVQSLAKWKRAALGRYGFEPGEGMYTNMSAIRRDDQCDSLHSIYVDQWDWELVITEDQRTVEFLKETVQRIVNALVATKAFVNNEYPDLHRSVCPDVTFITTQELEDRYPDLTPKQREDRIVEEKKTVFIMQIGDLLKSGEKHDGRAPDYDDWKLNGDLLLWNEVLNCAEEISSMGIRVDAESLQEQLKKAGCEERLQYPFHKGIIEGTLPLTIGGGIGQSRVCMFMLEKAHVGEVQVSIWPEDMIEACEAHGITLLQ